MIVFIRSLTDRATLMRLQQDRATRGVLFCEARRMDAFGSPEERYWQGKIDAYNAILEVG